MTLFKIYNNTETIYILKVGQFSISTNLTFGFNGYYSIGVDAWIQSGYMLSIKDFIKEC